MSASHRSSESTIGELTEKILNSRRISRQDQSQLMRLLCASYLGEREQDLVDKIYQGLHLGLIKVVDWKVSPKTDDYFRIHRFFFLYISTDCWSDLPDEDLLNADRARRFRHGCAIAGFMTRVSFSLLLLRIIPEPSQAPQLVTDSWCGVTFPRDKLAFCHRFLISKHSNRTLATLPRVQHQV